jgi:hypothetical protein
MSKLKIEHGVSRIRRAKLQASIDQSIAEDIQALADWSNNEPQYVINQLLRFALAQEEDFQKYKAGLAVSPAKPTGSIKPISSATRTAPETNLKSDPSATTRT